MARKTLLSFLIAALLTGLFGAGASAAAPQTVKVIIGLDHQPGPADEAMIAEAGGKVKHVYRLMQAMAIRVPETSLSAVLQGPGVLGIEEDSVVHTEDLELDNSWGVGRIGAGTVQAAGNRGTGVRVAIIDTGIDYNHPDLRANYAGGYDFVNDDADPMDDNGHGTHVAGTIAARDDGAGVVGVAPEASLYALKVLDAGGSGYSSDVIAAVEWAIANGIQITNNSYGRSTNPGPVYAAAFDRAYAAGILQIASAGNSGTTSGTGDTVGYPARLTSVVAVAATDKADLRAYWSSTGPDVEVAAPGAAINSTLPGGGYGLKSGTSMAAPHVTGLAALVFAAGITDVNGNGRINDEVRARIDGTADDLGSAGRDTYYGYGIVDAVEAAGTAAPPPAPAAPGTIQGTVTDGVAPVAGASVTDGTLAAVTDALGRYTLAGVPAGAYTLTAAAAGYQNASRTVTLLAGQTLTADFVLAKTAPVASTVRLASIAYAPDGPRRLRVTASLVDDLGKAVAAASVSVEIYRNGVLFTSFSGTTTASGEVASRVKNAGPGTYTSKVTNVNAAGLTWDGTTPPNSYTR